MKHNDRHIKLLLLGLVFFVIAALGAGTWYMLSQTPAVLQTAGDIGHKERSLIYFSLALSLLVVIPVFIMLGHIAWKYRASNTNAKYQPNWDRNNRIETAWWLIPTVLIAILSVVTWQSSHNLDPYRALSSKEKPIEVQVVSLQWKWLFIYPKEGIATVNYLQVPVDTPINFTLTSDAPMNSFWIPQLGGQIYTMPGMSTQLHLIADRQGTYHGASANISGDGFAGMRFDTKAVSKDAYVQWVAVTRQKDLALTMATYKQLALPSSNEPVRLYGNAQKGLFNDIIMQHMGTESSPATPKSPNTSQPTSHDYDMHDDMNMEGMME